MQPIEATELVHTGFHSQIFAVDGGKRPLLSKHFQAIAGSGFELPHAMEIIGAMRRFVDIASELGVPIAAPVGHYLEDNHHPQKANIVEIVPRIGRDVRQLCADPSIKDMAIERLIHQYLDLQRRVWEADFPISLDPPIANFCPDDRGNLCFIDWMPPRQKFPDGRIFSELPTPPEEYRLYTEARYFSPLQAQVIYAQILRGIVGRSISPVWVKNTIAEYLGEEAYRMIDLSQEDERAILTHPMPTDADAIRFLATEAMLEKRMEGNKMGEIYHLTHIVNGGILPSQENVTAAAQEVLRTKEGTI